MHKNIREFVNSVISESDDGLLTKLQSGYQRFQEQCDKILQQAGTDFNTLGSTIDSAIGTDSIGIIGKLSKLDSATQELQNNMSSHMANILEEAESWGSNMSNIYWDVVDAANAAAAALAEARAAAAAGLPEVPEIPSQDGNEEKDKDKNNTATQEDLIEKVKDEIAAGMWDVESNKVYKDSAAIENDIDKVKDEIANGQWNVNNNYYISDSEAEYNSPAYIETPETNIDAENITIDTQQGTGYFSQGHTAFGGGGSGAVVSNLDGNLLSVLDKYLLRYDTGGYTGSWGPSARLALLDEKELVLDKYDTANFLTALGVLDSILETINLNAISSSLGSPNVRSANVNNTSNNLEQKVTIHAEFPYATDRNEIQEAFNNLINTASQYANRK